MKIIVGNVCDGKWVLEASSEKEYEGDCYADVEAIYFFLSHAITVTCFDLLIEKMKAEQYVDRAKEEAK